ncbi:MAG TPA: ATP-binding protein [Chlamydiales bacterium]|nr:ATP-binding protein [Chlamydiales bacterium]
MFENVLKEQNPHWNHPTKDEWVKRHQFPKLIQLLATPHVISVAGVRRAGKSTLLKQLIHYLITDKHTPKENILFLNLEHPYFASYSAEIKSLHKIYEDYLRLMNPSGQIFILLDEVQFFQQWPIFVKALYEQKKCKFIVTGSNSTLLSSDLMSLLSGRTLPIEMFPLSFSELMSYHGLTRQSPTHQMQRLFDRYLMFGGFPDAALADDKSIAKDILNSMGKSILYQDVTARLNIKKPVDLERLFFYLISHISTPFTYKKLAELFSLNDKTIKEYIEAIQESNLLYQTEKFSYSLKAQMRHPKKPYAVDPGLVNSIAFQFSQNRGRLLENVVFLELKRRGYEVYYYKTKNDYEIDFLINKQNAFELIQVCSSLDEPSTRAREIRALEMASNEIPVIKKWIITEDQNDIINNIHIISVYDFLILDGV